MIQTIKDLVSAKADTTVALAREIWGYAELSYEETQVRRRPHRRPEARGLHH